jgi:hypothetical protein
MKEIYSLLIGKRISFILFNDVPQNGYGKWRIMPSMNTKSYTYSISVVRKSVLVPFTIRLKTSIN